MKKKLKLNFEQLEREMEVLPYKELKIIQGGNSSPLPWGFLADYINTYLNTPIFNSGSFTMSEPNSSGLRSINYNGSSVGFSLGMNESNAEISFDWNNLSLFFNSNVPNYNTPPDPTSFNTPGSGNHSSGGIRITF